MSVDLGVAVRPFAQMFETKLEGEKQGHPGLIRESKGSGSPRGSHAKWVQQENPQMTPRRNKDFCLLSSHRTRFLWESFHCQFLSTNPFYGVCWGFQGLACFQPALVTPTSLTPNLDTHAQSVQASGCGRGQAARPFLAFPWGPDISSSP